jgi:D-alanyl-D-alanine carboxypeptidase
MKKARIITALVLIAVIALVSACGDSDKEGSATDDEIDSPAVEPASPYEAVYYYEPALADRYSIFAAAHKDLSPEDVVWMVDADLDKEVYQDTSESKAPDSLTALVNKHFSLPDDYEPDDLVEIDVTTLRKEAADALEEMRAAAAEEDLTLVAQSGYRSYARQSELYEGYRQKDADGADTYSSRPGFSEHQTGLAIDVNYAIIDSQRAFTDTPEAAWVLENGYKYGFIVRYTPENEEYTGYESEAWHLRYIGTNNATRMHDEGIISFEEYWVKFVTHVPK